MVFLPIPDPIWTKQREQFIYLLIDTIQIHHSWIGKYIIPIDVNFHKRNDDMMTQAKIVT